MKRRLLEQLVVNSFFWCVKQRSIGPLWCASSRLSCSAITLWRDFEIFTFLRLDCQMGRVSKLYLGPAMLAHLYMGLSELWMRGSEEKENGKKEWLGPSEEPRANLKAVPPTDNEVRQVDLGTEGDPRPIFLNASLSIVRGSWTIRPAPPRSGIQKERFFC